MSGNVDSVISKSGLVENVGVEVEIAFSVRSIVIAAFVFTAAILDLRLPVARDSVGISTFGFFDLENRGWGSRWNFDPMCQRTRDMPGVGSDPPLCFASVK